jgi:hypothetical protein
MKKLHGGPVCFKNVDQECIDITRARGLASCLDQHNRVPMQKYMTLIFVEYRILTDSQAAIKALDNYQINCRLDWNCHQPLIKLAEHTRVQLIWVSGHGELKEIKSLRN